MVQARAMSQITPIDAPGAIARAARALRAGALVAFPTETVYGLGADATDDRAVARVFAAKGRPRFNPLIVHVPDLDGAEAIAVLDDRARALAARFWPGALTLVLPRRDDAGLSRLVGAGLPSIALRLPDHAGARALLAACARPLAAPSANPSGRLSPTTAAHVAEGLGDKVDLILDGGATAVGLESSVLDLTGAVPVLLRPGGVPVEALEGVLGRPVARAGTDDTAPKSPGMLTQHYAPRAPVRLNATDKRPGEALLGFAGTPGADLDLSPAGNDVEAAANLFAYLHALDARAPAGIAVAPIPDAGLGLAINDRLRRAAAGR